MQMLSSPLESLSEHYDAIVIGSGLWGRDGRFPARPCRPQGCLFERGREEQPGEYPDTAMRGAPKDPIQLPGNPTARRHGDSSTFTSTTT